MKKYTNIFIMAVGLIFSSCADKLDDVNMDLSADTDIHAFVINGKQAKIDNTTNTIMLELPGGTDMTTLTPIIEIGEGATVMPASGTMQNFSRSKSNPLEYKVINGNIVNTYKVTVVEIRPRITNFSVGNYTVHLDDEAMKITVYTDGDENVSALTPTIEYTEGATLSPTSGETVNLTNPIEYKLSYEGQNYTYAVTTVTSPVMTFYNGENIRPNWIDIAGWDGSKMIIGINIDNPDRTEANPTAYCMSIPRKNTNTDDGGRPWSGGGIMNSQLNISPLVYGRLSAKVLKQVAGPVTFELQGPNVDNYFVTAQYTEEHLGEWQELFFDIPVRTAPITNILIRPHDTNDGLSSTSTMMYWDEMKAYPRGSLPQIMNFSINGVVGIIDQDTHSITMDASSFSDITALTPIVMLKQADASVSPASGETVDFTKQPTIYTVTSAQGITIQYKVFLTGIPVIIYNGETIFATWWDIEAWNNAEGRTLLGININNPDKSGVNTSSKCISIPRTNNNNNEGGYPHSGGALWHEPNPQLDIDPVFFGSFKMMVKKPLAGPVLIEIQDNNPIDESRVKHYLLAQYTDVGSWQELTFDIPAERTAHILNLLIRIHDTNDGLTSTPTMMYWDELRVLPR